MWYALKVGSEIRKVQWFSGEPSIMDFSSIISSQLVYEVVKVDVREID